MSRQRRRALFLVAAVGLLYGLTWLLGVPSADKAIQALDQARLRVAGERWGVPKSAALPSELAIQRFLATHRVVLPALIYCEGQSYTHAGPIADTVKPSLVFWYGASSVVLWQSKEWLPGRSTRLRQLAETGY